MTVRRRSLTKREILPSFRKTNALYPYILPLSLWRAWEIAAYRHYALKEPVLDLGCGDGRFFQLCFPRIKQVWGVDLDAHAVELARQSGVYREVCETPADRLPFDDEMFGTVFSNCAMEHMDNIDMVLGEMRRVLRNNGMALFSVVTDQFVELSPLRRLLELIGAHDLAKDVQSSYEEFHRLANPFSIEQWIEHITASGMIVDEYIPILPHPVGSIFLMFDELWHIPHDQFEFGTSLHRYFQGFSRFDRAALKILEGLLELTSPSAPALGVVFRVHKPQLVKESFDA
jgi:SAM-dependent methyltransferase